MADNDWQSLQYFANSINASAGMIAAADLSRANRQFYQEQYDVQRDYNRAERIAAQEYNTSERIAVQDFNMNMWNLNNEYNSPSAQMARMIEAGINPNSAAMAIGQSGGSASPVSSSPMSSPSASVSPPGMPQTYNPVEAMASIQNMNANAEQQLSQAHLNQAVADKTREETHGLVIDNNFKPFEKEAHLDYAYTQIDYQVSQKILTDEQANQIKQMLPLYQGKTTAEISEINAQVQKYSAEYDVLVQQRDLVQAQIDSELHRQSLMDAQQKEAYNNAKLADKAIELNDKKISLTDAQKYVEEQNGRLKKLDADWIECCQNVLNIDPRYDNSYLTRILTQGQLVLKYLQSPSGSQTVDPARVNMYGKSSYFGSPAPSVAPSSVKPSLTPKPLSD